MPPFYIDSVVGVHPFLPTGNLAEAVRRPHPEQLSDMRALVDNDAGAGTPHLQNNVVRITR